MCECNGASCASASSIARDGLPVGVGADGSGTDIEISKGSGTGMSTEGGTTQLSWFRSIAGGTAGVTEGGVEDGRLELLQSLVEASSLEGPCECAVSLLPAFFCDLWRRFVKPEKVMVVGFKYLVC